MLSNRFPNEVRYIVVHTRTNATNKVLIKPTYRAEERDIILLRRPFAVRHRVALFTVSHTQKKIIHFHFKKSTVQKSAALYHGCEDKARHNFSWSKPPIPHDPQARSDRSPLLAPSLPLAPRTKLSSGDATRHQTSSLPNSVGKGTRPCT